MNCEGGAPFRARLPFATAFPPGLPYNGPVGRKGGGARDGGLSGQRVCPQRPHGLSAGALRRPAGGNSPPAGAVRSGGRAGRRLRRGGVPAGTWLSGHGAGKAGGRGAALPHRLRRGGEAAAADAAVLRRLLRHGRVRAGPGAAGRRRRPHGRRRLLHGRGRQGAADRRRRGLSDAVRGVPGIGPPRRPGGAGDGADKPAGPDGGHHRPSRHGQRPPGSGLRHAGAGGGAGRPGRAPAEASAAKADGGGPGPPGLRSGGSRAGRAGAAAPPGALSGGGCGERAAAGPAQRVDGGGRPPVSGGAGGPGPR